MAYKTIHTNYGERRMAQAEASGVQINLTAISVGDGGGNPTTPDPEQTQLVREIFRGAPNRVFQDPDNSNLFTVELLIPASVGGFTIREAAAFDDQGGMFVVANVPSAYKPVGDGSEGAFSDTALRLQFLVTNADVVTLMIDPNVVVATQQWIKNTITVPYLLPGGTTGQVLKKKSNADGDTEWADPSIADAIVSIVEEVQTLAAGQTAVLLTECTTEGLAVYVAGDRLLPTAWTPDPVDVRKLTLAASYPDGTKVDFVQNEPGADRALLRSRNLADIESAATARSNLGVYSKEETDQKAPPSQIAFFACSKAPAGWLKANGAAVSRTAYAGLFAAIGTMYGQGDGFNTFNVPDMRGEFPRGWDDGRGVDNSRALGSQQASQNLAHVHGASASTAPDHSHGASTDLQGEHTHGYDDQGHAHNVRIGRVGVVATSYGQGNGPYNWDRQDTYGTDVSGVNINIRSAGKHGHNITVNPAGKHDHTISINTSGGSEARPRNVALLACIKF
ncbi:phage tail protein [Burkholderia sp. Bp9015]|uniref:phage tail-collar fiber domain-containing protein n=1 Tax=Burkholderia sp. Bp9015 TaxID=2184563 RepID=UPI000F5AD4B4|nr:phage tail protein [Burkholderia sp. Bp9015]RQR78684.1 phage tail protein [Burkholderia sp. Bp9015]